MIILLSNCRGGYHSLILGTMVSADDYSSLAIDGSEFSELLLFNGDLERLPFGDVPDRLVKANPPIRYVHVQEFINHDGAEVLVDLSSEDETIRRKSVQVVAATRAFAHGINDSAVVFHPGGIRNGIVDHERLMSNLEESLSELGPTSLLMENMPWYYWFRKRERMVSNICVLMEDMMRLESLIEGFTLDTCHGYLSRPEGDSNYCERFMEALGDKILHIHASDARAPDQEGLQIGEGDVNFSFLGMVEVPILAEVWNGHLNEGAGFRTSIDRLLSLRNEYAAQNDKSSLGDPS